MSSPRLDRDTLPGELRCDAAGNFVYARDGRRYTLAGDEKAPAFCYTVTSYLRPIEYAATINVDDPTSRREFALWTSPGDEKLQREIAADLWNAVSKIRLAVVRRETIRAEEELDARLVRLDSIVDEMIERDRLAEQERRREREPITL